MSWLVFPVPRWILPALTSEKLDANGTPLCGAVSGGGDQAVL